MKVCIKCKKPFNPMDAIGKTNPLKKFCSNECRISYHNERISSFNLKLDLHTATVGAIGELRVCIDLLLKGYQVFRNVCASGVDLVVWNGNKILMIEVTTGRYNSNGKISKNKYQTKKFKHRTWDHVAVILSSGEIFYDPPLNIKG